MKHGLDSHVRLLRARATTLREQRIENLFAADPERMQHLVAEAAGLRLDLSKNLIDPDTLAALLELAGLAAVAAAAAAMCAGAEVNPTEGRAALHTALRRAGASDSPVPHAATIAAVRERMSALVADVRSGRRSGHTGAAFTDVVNIGIGGSHLGPQLACDALRYATTDGPRAHFLANVDGGEFDRIVGSLNPDTTLFIVASKSFSTVETRLNALSARAWLAARHPAPAAIADHFLAVSANPARAIEFGIAEDNVYPMWDWVGGRYSMWSAIGLPVALSRGMDVFDQLLAGAAAMDEHFLDAPPARNLPLLLALTGIWNSTFLGAESYAVIPYDDRLRYLPDYLQQLEMESNGKRVTLAGEPLDHHSAPVTWGGLGTNAQHAFFQLLHQGTRFIPVDFVVAMRHPAARPQHHDMLVANCIAQAEALMTGRPADAADALGAHRATPGNRPSTLLSVDDLTPSTLGALIALYEHKTYVHSVIWDINAFDQWGVELGKQLASTVLEELAGERGPQPHDPSTTALIDRYRSLRRG